MLLTNLLRNVRRTTTHSRKTRRPYYDLAVAAGIESLEDRTLLSGMTFTVTNTDDAGSGSLRAAVGLANGNPGEDTIRFARRVHGEIALTSGDEIFITDDVVIRGPGANRLAVSGEGLTRVFTVMGVDVEIRNLTITNGQANDAPGYPPAFGFAFGGGIYNLAGHLTLRGVNMTDNNAGSFVHSIGAGGAIGNEFGGTLEVARSRFSNNAALGGFIAVGGAISQDIGPTLDGKGTAAPSLDISHSRFDGNSATAAVNDPVAAGPFAAFAGFALGGAVANVAGIATITHTTFVDNSVQGGSDVLGNAGASAVGGAIFTDDFSPFDEFPADGLGRDAELNVAHSVFIRNVATGGNGDAASDGGSAYGGAIGASITFLPEAANISHSTFRNNKAVGGNGGAAGGTGGGTGGGATGGAVAAIAGASVAVNHSSFTRNTARGGAGGSGADGGEGRGGAIGLNLLKTSVPTPFEGLVPSASVSHSILAANRAIGGAGGIAGGHGGLGAGGGIGVDDGATAEVFRTLLIRNRAVGGQGGAGGGDGGNAQGGGISNGDSTITIRRSSVLGNRARGGNATAGGDDGVGSGGGIFNDLDGDLNIDLISLWLTRFNHADDGDNVFGPITLL